MRTTVTLDPDVVAAVTALRERDRIGLSEAVNQLVRAGAARHLARTRGQPFVQPTADLGLLIDISNVAEVLELLDETE